MTRVVSLHRPAAVSGVSAAGVRLAMLPPPYTAWRPLVIGESSDGDPARLLAHSPLRNAPGVCACAWRPGATVVERIGLVGNALRTLGAEVVVPNDLAEGFAAAALAPEVAIAAWYHADHHDGDELLLRCGELADAWRAVSDRGAARVLRRAREWSLAVRGAGGVCPAYVDVPERPRGSRQPDGRLALLFAGRLEKQTKRVLDLIPLVRSIRAAGVRVRLTIAGDGPANEELRAAAADEGVLDAFDFRGVVPLAAMPALIDACDAAVLVSESEGMPTIVMEAMAAGRPVAITTGCGLAVSVVNHGIDGLIATTGDMDTLGAAIAGAYSAAMLGRMGEAAHAKARANFSAAAMGPRYDRFIAEALAARAARPAPGVRWNAILAAIEAVGPVSAAEIGAIASDYERCHQLAAGGLPRVLPGRPGPAARLLDHALRQLAAAGSARIGLFGAGRHTEKVAAVIAASERIVCFIDDRAGGGGLSASALGLPVLTPREAITFGIDAVVINSDEHEREMLPRARAWAGPIPVIGLYGELSSTPLPSDALSAA